MSERNDGGPAFPREDYQTDNAPGQEGMALRDYFAAKAMQGILAGPCSRDGVSVKKWGDVPGKAYEIADAMLAEREK